MDNLAWDWLAMSKQQRQSQIQALLDGKSKVDYIKLVDAGSLGVYASLGSHFDYAIFGRDSIQVASDLLSTHQLLCKDIIHALASLQGVKKDSKNEEEPGKIHHEYRALEMNGSKVSEQSVTILRKLQQTWGTIGTDNVCYYGSYDATPLYIRLIGDYVDLYGPDLLDESYHGLDGPRHIRDSIESAVNWLVKKIESSDWGLLEYHRLNPNFGLKNQVWKDSSTSYLHKDGSLANTDLGIASIELQGYSYDALIAASKIIPTNSKSRDHWIMLAEHLQQETISKFWMPELHYFAQGLDRGINGQLIQIDTLTSNPGLLLDSKLLSNLNDKHKSKYIDSIANMIASTDFLTPAGVRCRALSHKQMPGFIDYHGSYTVWPKETHAIAKGLKTHGKSALANRLDSGILDSIRKAGEFCEFFYVDDQNMVYYSHGDAREHFRSQSLDKNIAIAEPGQAWTISAVLDILSNVKYH